jgi:hypothetical protein
MIRVSRDGGVAVSDAQDGVIEPHPEAKVRERFVKRMRVHDLKTGREINGVDAVNEYPSYDHWALAVDPVGEWFVANSYCRDMEKYSVATGAVILEDDDRYHSSCPMEVSSDSMMIFSHNGDIIDSSTFGVIRRIHGVSGGIRCSKFIGPHNDIFIGCCDGTAHRFSSATGAHMVSCAFTDEKLQETSELGCIYRYRCVTSVGANASGTLLLTATGLGHVKMWDGATGQLLMTACDGHYCDVDLVRFVDEERLVFSTSSYEMIVSNATNLSRVNTIDGMNYRSMDISADETVVAMLADNGAITVMRGDDRPWMDCLRFRFDGRNFMKMPPEFRTAARTFLLCCVRHRREGGGVLAELPRDMRQVILIELSLLIIHQ